MNYSEVVSKRVLEAIVPGATLKYREVQTNGEYDFDLLYSDGTIAAVEATAAVDRRLAETIAAVRSKRKGGSIIKATACKESWLIVPAKRASINSLRAAADRCLDQLEHEGIDRFYCVSTSPSVRNICYQLQITGGGVISSETEPTIKIAFPLVVAQLEQLRRQKPLKERLGSKTIVKSLAMQQLLSVTSLSTWKLETGCRGLRLPVSRNHQWCQTFLSK